ncbi:acetyltransferase GNAT family [Rhodotorula toruloides]|uniref:Acetyltransferase GNAT family n=1 Tax=Rhodotorula toruloides TaxID=5286 RepID=A0A511KRZ2_RHOTO|nr:acetyltransferase GNAT family [Rhodotorula toruloides]
MHCSPNMLQILPATVADVPRLVEIGHSAFAGNALNHAVFGNVDPQVHREHSIKRQTKALESGKLTMIKAVVGGEIVGVAMWSLPKSEEDKAAEKKGDEAHKENEWPPGTDVELATEMFMHDAGIKEPHYLGLPVYERAGFEPFGPPHASKIDPEHVLYPMRRAPLRIERATLDDLPALASIHRLAFFPGAITQYCFRDVSLSNFDAWFVKRFTSVLEKREKGEKVEVLVGKRVDKPVALVYYGLEPELEKRGKDDTPRQFPKGANVEEAADILGQMDAHIKKIPFAHCSWHIISVHPDAQGTGVGWKMMQAVLDAGKAAGLPVTLEATEEGRPMYQLAGFKDFAEVIVAKGDENVKLWPMIYEQSKE